MYRFYLEMFDMKNKAVKRLNGAIHFLLQINVSYLASVAILDCVYFVLDST